jgi:hypothetical protein
MRYALVSMRSIASITTTVPSHTITSKHERKSQHHPISTDPYGSSPSLQPFFHVQTCALEHHLQSKESKNSAEERRLDRDTNRRGSTSELGRGSGSGVTIARNSAGNEASGGSVARGDGVRRSSGLGGNRSRCARDQSDRRRLGGSSTRRSRGCGRRVGREVNLRNRDGSGVGGRDAGAVGAVARNSGGGLVGDGGERHRWCGSCRRGSCLRGVDRSRTRSRRSRSRGGGDGDVGRAVGDETRVLRDVLSADTNEVGESVLGVLVIGPRGNTVDDRLGEVGVLAVAGSVRVVLAVRLELEPGVHALGQALRR